MATEIKKLIIALAGSPTAANAQTLEAGRLVSDGVRLRMHDGSTAGGLKCLMTGEGGSAPDFDTVAITASGDTTFTWASLAIHACRYVTIGAGSGAYTRNLILPTTYSGNTLPAGTQCKVIIVFAPTVADYHVDIYSAATSNPKLMRASSRAGEASAAEVTLVFNGTAWLAGPLVYST